MSPLKPLLGETDMSEFLRPDEKQINPDNVWEDDAFKSLGKYATFLTNALTTNKKNFVLNVNGPWGTGKSFFVQRWAVELRKQYPVIEYNAWKNDSEDDPLSSLLAVCAEGLKEYFSTQQNLIDNLKKKGGRVALRLGGLAVKAGLRALFDEKSVSDVCNIFSDATENDLIDLGGTLVEEQIKKQQERESFVEELEKLVAKLDADSKLPVFIFIDELDRCRPTFAIELLERVKHLFGVDGIKFIISTDTEQLVHSISGVYGDRFDGCTYLQRFFDETFTLPFPDAHQFARGLLDGIDSDVWQNWMVVQSPAFTFGELSTQFRLTLREQYKAYHRIMMVIGNIDVFRGENVHFMYICVLVMLRIKWPDDYNNLMISKHKKEIWDKIKTNHHISTAGIKVIDNYFVLIGLKQTEIRKASFDADRTPAKLPDLWIDMNEAERRFSCDIYDDCSNRYNKFIKYPKLVELTETLS